MNTGESARDYLAKHVTPEQRAEVEAFLNSLPEPDGSIQEVFARAYVEAIAPWPGRWSRSWNPHPWTYLPK